MVGSSKSGFRDVVSCEAVTLKGVVKGAENGDNEGMGGVAAISATHDPRHRCGHLFPEGVQRAHNHVRLGVTGVLGESMGFE